MNRFSFLYVGVLLLSLFSFQNCGKVAEIDLDSKQFSDQNSNQTSENQLDPQVSALSENEASEMASDSVNPHLQGLFKKLVLRPNMPKSVAVSIVDGVIQPTKNRYITIYKTQFDGVEMNSGKRVNFDIRPQAREVVERLCFNAAETAFKTGRNLQIHLKSGYPIRCGMTFCLTNNDPVCTVL